MAETYKNKTEAQNALFAAWKQESPEGIYPDGIVNEAAYEKARTKVLFLLKEVNGDGDWDYLDFVRKGARAQTWDNITRWTHGIEQLPEQIAWREVEHIKEEDRKLHLPKIAVVNVKKTSGTGSADNEAVRQYARENRERLMAQIRLCAPELVICCGTGEIYRQEIFALGNGLPFDGSKKYGLRYLQHEGRLVIDYFHPNSRISKRLLYFGLLDGLGELLTARA